jgi:hypothetical protein
MFLLAAPSQVQFRFACTLYMCDSPLFPASSQFYTYLAIFIAVKKPVGTAREFSVTIQRDGQDLDTDRCKPLVGEWAEEYCEAAFFGVERGGTCGNLHLQGVIRLKTTAVAQSVTKSLKKALGFGQPGSQVCDMGTVMSKKLSQKGMHTFAGLVGYCSKDMRQPWFSSIELNVTQREKELGYSKYVEEGAADIVKNACVLTPHNVLQRAYVYWKFHLSSELVRPMFIDIIVKMHRTGRFIPDAKWVIEQKGGAMHVSRIEAAWALITNPGVATPELIDAVYFNYNTICSSRSRYMNQPGPVVNAAIQHQFVDLEAGLAEIHTFDNRNLGEDYVGL